MKKISIAVLFLLFSNHAYAERIHIVASLPALGQIAQGVAGTFADVKVLARVGQDPHFVPPKPTLARHLAHADLLIEAGLGLEIGWLPPLMNAARNDAIRAGSKGYIDGRDVLTRVLGKPTGKITRALGDIHPEGNPHWWMDPINGAHLAGVIAQRLATLDPPHAADYRQHAASFAAQINEKLVLWQPLFQALTPFVAYHNSYLYLTHRFHLQVIDFVEPKPGIEPSTSHLDALVHTMQQSKVKGLWLEPYHDGAIARKVCVLAHVPCRLMPDAVAQEGFAGYIHMFDVLAAGGS